MPTKGLPKPTGNGSSGYVNVRSYGGFYKNKSVLKSYKFDVWFNFDKYLLNLKNAAYLATRGGLQYVTRIKPYHVLSVDVPFASFSREATAIGTMQYSIPVLAKEQALDIKITMEEDDIGTVAGFIHEMQESIVRNGFHVPPSQSRLGDIWVNIDNDQDGTVSGYKAKDVFFLGASSISPSYDSNDSVKYELTFGTDYMEFDGTGDLLTIARRATSLRPSNLLF